jgi:hypothetical protein
MVEHEEPGRDLAGLVVPLACRLVATGDRWEPYRLVGADGRRSVPLGRISVIFRRRASGAHRPLVRDGPAALVPVLLGVGGGRDQATRPEARDFCRWLQLAGKPVRLHWRERGRPGMGAAVPVAGEVYAPSVRAHNETVLRSFYDFHLGAGTGPLVNPFPLDRSRRGGRAHAHRNPMEPFVWSAAACTGPGAGLPAREPGCAVRARVVVAAMTAALPAPTSVDLLRPGSGQRRPSLLFVVRD